MNIVMWCTAIIFVSACIVYFSTKRIAADIYIKTVRIHENIDPEEELPPSPYSLKRAKAGNSSNIGYTIMKNNDHLYIAGTANFYDVFVDLSSAIRQMNIYEKLDNVKLTKLD